MKLVAGSFNVVFRVKSSVYFAKDIGTCKKVPNIREEQSSSQAYYLRPRPTDKHYLYPLHAVKKKKKKNSVSHRMQVLCDSRGTEKLLVTCLRWWFW